MSYPGEFLIKATTVTGSAGTALHRLLTVNTLALLVVLIAAIPLFYVLWNSLQLDAGQWQSLWTNRLPELMANTLALALCVAAGCLLLGLPGAYLLARRRFRGKTVAVWLMILPLAVPTYVFAYIYSWLMADDGWLGRLWLWLFGDGATVPDLYNLFGVTMVITMASFSYVFLLAWGALRRSNQSLEEAARMQGYNKRQVFLRVTLPMLRPALAAALAVVVLHVLSDFGAVSMLRFQTFTLAIYSQMSGRFDYQAAAGLSLVLVSLSLVFFVLERFFRRRQRYFAAATARILQPRQASPREQVLIWTLVLGISTFTLFLPLGWMLSWSLESLLNDSIGARFGEYAFNTMLVATVAALIAIFAAFPVAYYNARRQSPLSRAYIQLSSVGFVLPGPVIALGILSFILAQLPLIYTAGGITMLAMALVIRFLPLAIQAQDASLQQLTPSIEQAGRLFGAGPVENFRRVILPMIRGGMSTAFVLVFIDALKELPATLILRPTGFDTLPIRIWIEASEEMLEHAAPAALMLVIATLPAMWIMMRER